MSEKQTSEGFAAQLDRLMEEAMSALRPAVARALRAFRAAMSRASDENIWLLHGALEKDQLRIVRGGWGAVECNLGSRGLRRAAACPLTALFVGVPQTREDLRRAEQLAEAHLRDQGLTASDFYGVWDRSLIQTRDLLREVDDEATRRAARPPKGRAATTPPQRRIE
jgi:hypothetical protein